MNDAAPITARAVLLGALASGLLALANPWAHYVAGAWSIGWGALPMGVVFALFLLVAANGVLARLCPRRAFRRGELLVAYATMIVTFPLVRMVLPYLFGTLSFAFYRASPENNWEHLIWPHVVPWIRPTSAEAINGFWEGLGKGQGPPWAAWIGPLVAWGLFTLALMAAMFCLACLMRRDWIESQRLTFPLVEVPLAMAGDRSVPTLRRSILGNRVFWAGFAIPAVVSILHWVSRLAPAVPSPPLEYMIGRTFAGMGLPWSILAETRIRLYFAVIGVACLIPAEVSLSLWLFYVLSRLELLALASLGFIGAGGSGAAGFDPRAFVNFTEVGGFIALSLAVLWQSRGRFGAAARRLLPGACPEADPYAPLSPRAALIGFVLANGFMLWWAVRAGMSWWSYSVLMTLFYVVMIGLSRLVAAAGVMRPDTAIFPFPRQVMVHAIGAAPIGAGSLTVMAHLSITYMLDIENSIMPQMMNSFKLLHHGRLQGSRFPQATAVVTIVVLTIGSVALLEVAYRYGATSVACWPLSGAATCAFRALDSSLRSPEAADNWRRGAMVGGAGFTILLTWLGSRFVWWPVSPIGFVVASAFFTNYGLWFNTLIGWALATAIRRYGGLRLYRSLRPAFLGLVLGEFLTRSALAAISVVIGLKGADGFALA